MGKNLRVFSSERHEHRSQNPVIVRHLKMFRFLGSNPLTLEVGRFSEISKPFFTLISVFLIFHTIYFVYHLTELEAKAPFSTVLGIFRRSAFSLGPVLSFYKFVKNRTRIAKTLDELVAIQKVFGMADYKLFPTIKVFGALTFGTSAYRAWMGFWTIYHDHGDVSTAIKRFESAALTVYIFACVANFTYLVKCVSSCVQHLSDRGLKDKVNEPSVRRYVKIYTHLVSISEEINSHFDACISFCFLAWFLNVMDSTSDLLGSKDREYVDTIWKLLKLGFGVTGMLHVVTTGQSAIDQAENCNEVLYSTLIQLKSLPVENNIHSFVVMHLGAEKTIRYRLCESFAINYNLAISMAAAYVTYITVMFQLDHVTSTGVSGNSTAAVY